MNWVVKRARKEKEESMFNWQLYATVQFKHESMNESMDECMNEINKGAKGGSSSCEFGDILLFLAHFSVEFIQWGMYNVVYIKEMNWYLNLHSTLIYPIFIWICLFIYL